MISESTKLDLLVKIVALQDLINEIPTQKGTDEKLLEDAYHSLELAESNIDKLYTGENHHE